MVDRSPYSSGLPGYHFRSPTLGRLSHASTCSCETPCNSITTFGIPVARTRRPVCAAGRHVFSRPHSGMKRQWAVNAAHTSPGTKATAMLASVSKAACPASHTGVRCTCLKPDSSHASASRALTRARFIVTALELSPTQLPRSQASKGEWLMLPTRDAAAERTPAGVI